MFTQQLNLRGGFGLFEGVSIELGGAGAVEKSLDVLKWKFEAMVGGIEGAAIVSSGGVEHGGLFKLTAFFGNAGLLERFEFGEIFFAMAAQAGFLELQVAQLLFVLEEGLEVGEAGVFGGCIFCAAAGVDGGFERGDAEETPIGVGDRLHEDRFASGDGFEFFGEAFEVMAVEGGIVRGEEHGASGERSFDGVDGRACFAFGGTGTGGALRVGTVGGEASG